MKKIMEFQVANGISPVAAIGPKTIAKMKSLWQITNEQLANFLGQIHHETGGFEKDTEGFNYSVKRLLEVFKRDFDTNRDRFLSESEKAKVYTLIGNPVKIANFVYANQNGNGNEASGDGWKFKGRGAIMVTGRYNYMAFAKWLSKRLNRDVVSEIMNNPDLLATKYYWETAFWFFDLHNLWIPAKSVSRDKVRLISIIINGGENGLDDRIEKVAYYNQKIKQAA